ncbi:peptidase inhibitor family I36 protein [Amycolatopsis lurida]
MGVLISAAMVFVTSGAALAQSGQSMQGQVDEVLRWNPGARQVDARSVELEPGFVVHVLDEYNASAAPCGSGYVCIYSDPGFQGYIMTFYNYGFYNLAKYNYPGGGKWAHRTSSYRNYQTGHAKANFSRYQATNNTWYGVDECRATCERSTLGTADNIIDGVRLEP